MAVVLIVEPDTELATAMGELLLDDGFEICITNSLKHAVGQLPATTVQGMVIDVDGIPLYSDHSSLKLVGDWFRHRESPPPLILLSLCSPSSSSCDCPGAVDRVGHQALSKQGVSVADPSNCQTELTGLPLFEAAISSKRRMT